eukprot:gene1573-32958_t
MVDNKVILGQNNIARAWLGEPTNRYPHGVFGDPLEAGAVFVQLQNGTELSFHIDQHQEAGWNRESVFEDVSPRLWDLDGDGEDEVWTVRSDRSDGGRLEAYAVVNGKLQLRFAAAPIGTGFRWLNPIGVGAFDANTSANQVAYVQTPHIGGIVTVLKPEGKRLVPIATREGYSNHEYGSTSLDLSAVADLDGDGATELVVPAVSLAELVVLSLKEGQLVERARTGAIARIAGGLKLSVGSSGDWQAEYQTADGCTSVVAISKLAL